MCVIHGQIVLTRRANQQHGIALCQVADGGNGNQLWKVAANTLNKEQWTNDKGRSSALGSRVWITTIHSKNELVAKNLKNL
jgi:hypothetical protein